MSRTDQNTVFKNGKKQNQLLTLIPSDAEAHMKKKYLEWLPLLITVCCACVALPVYTVTAPKKDITIYLQLIGTAFIPLILPIFSRMTKKQYPLALNILIALHIVLAVDLGSAMNFYDSIYCWDMILHGYFGFIASIAFYVLLRSWNRETHFRFGFYVMVFLSTMGCAAIWEIFEFVCDTLLHSDAQRVAESSAMGHTPVYDTMMDLIIATAGYAVFCIGILIRNRFGKPLHRAENEATKSMHFKR